MEEWCMYMCVCVCVCMCVCVCVCVCVVRYKPWVLLDGWMEGLKPQLQSSSKKELQQEKWQYAVQASSVRTLFLTRILRARLTEGPSH